MTKVNNNLGAWAMDIPTPIGLPKMSTSEQTLADTINELIEENQLDIVGRMLDMCKSTFPMHGEYVRKLQSLQAAAIVRATGR